MTPIPDSESEQLTLALQAEEFVVTRRQVEGDRVRVSTRTRLAEHLVDEELSHVRVVVERVPVGRTVDAVPPVREEGDVTIIPVVEEVVVVERRLFLKEEVHMRRVRVTERHRETVTLRTQDAVITRTEAGQSIVADDRPPLGTDPSMSLRSSTND